MRDDIEFEVKQRVQGLEGMTLLPLETALLEYKAQRDWHDDIARFLGELKSAIDTARQATIPTMFKTRGVTSLTVHGYRYTISDNVRASIIPDKKLEAFEWLRNHDLEDLIIETVNASTLSAQAKLMMEGGEELDQDLFKSYILQTTSVTKA